MKTVRQILDATLGRWIRHFFFVLVGTFYGLFYNISCADKSKLQNLPGALFLSTHVSRHDGPMLAALFYSTQRVRPAVKYDEYYSWGQWFPMMIAGAVPVGSPKGLSQSKRLVKKEQALSILQKIIANGNMVLLFPAGMVKKQSKEIIKPKFSGTYDTLKAMPDIPVVLIKIRGLGTHEPAVHDRFWIFLGRKKGRRHVHVDFEVLENGLDTNLSLADFNADLELRFNEDP